MDYDSVEEALYRLEVAKEHLERAREALKVKDYPACVGFSQLCIENAAKSVIALYRIPSWTHDPSAELREVIQEHQKEVSNRMGPPAIEKLSKLAQAAETLAPEHGRVSYGDIRERKPPKALYTEPNATGALQLAEISVIVAEEAVEYLSL